MGARELRGSKVVVAGLGKSGVAAARLLVREGARVVGTDLRDENALGPVAGELAALGVALELGGHRRETFASADLVVKSPGISPSVPAIAAAMAAGVPVVGEVELCAPWLARPVVGITGTNGKSTTTALLGHLLAAAGKKAFVGGNLGTPVAEQVLSGESVDATVLELSSYQIDDLVEFQCDVAVVLNVTPDHLERYGTVETYAASKARLLAHIRPDGFAILNADDPVVARMAEGTPPRVVTFGHGAPVPAGHIRASGGRIVRAGEAGEERYEVRSPALRGPHNLENAMAAVEAARALGVSAEAIALGLASFTGLPHRIERVLTFDGVDWINDSKATNVDSVLKSLAAFAGPLHLVMGGRGKGAAYAPLRPLLPGRVARLYVIGEDAARIADELGDLVPVERPGDLSTAVLLAHGFARPGETVLLSPACSSFDQFTSFEHRGEEFRRLVEALAGG